MSLQRPFKRILIANRGEIACRVMRTAQRLGYGCVAVYSDADAPALHVRSADMAVRLGPAPAAQSYLDIAALLRAAENSGADAVHPGYGFLSERADFAQACADAGLVFIGPSAAAIREMGNKARAKRRMIAAGVPCVPGYMGEAGDENPSDSALQDQARRLGLPLLVKAVCGGGGRGMRLVQDFAELPGALASARREALSAFGDGALMLERPIAKARHVEVQIFADSHGQTLHLGERDCTAQRRRQKLIEESPCPAINAAQREAMGRDAVAAARSVGYCGAGTVEFIVDEQLRHHFLEMNTRLQVEHPVTECVTGIDLVEWQIRVAAGEPLPLTQAQIRFSGHAIEARLCAEDPGDGWAPQTGRVTHWRPEAAGVRVDHGIAEGDEITPYYDGMVAKFIAHGHDRDDALRRLTHALAAAPLLGVKNNGRFLRDLLQHPQFVNATINTTRLDEWAEQGEPLLQDPAAPEAAWRIAAALRGGGTCHRPASVAQFDLTLSCQGQARTRRAPAGDVLLADDGDHGLRFQIDGLGGQAICVDDGQTLQLALAGAQFSFTEPSPWPQADPGGPARQARAAVAGVVVQVLVREGDAVRAGQPLVCVEAMKMDMWVSAGTEGTVAAVHVAVHDRVAAAALLVEVQTGAAK